MRHILLFVACALAAAGAHADVNKWVDSEGRVHYSDQPPPASAKPQPLNIKPAPAANTPQPGEAAPKTTAEKEVEFRKRRAQEEEARVKQEKAQQDANQKQQNCTQAQNNLRNLQAGGRLYTYDEKGERAYMDDAARQKAIADAQKAVDSWCK